MSTRLIWTKKALLARLHRGYEARKKFVESQISNGIAFQIRALRSRERWNQSELAEKVGTTQNQIYRLEKPSVTKPTISTLKKIAAAFDVALVVRFVPFSQLVDWVSGTPFLDTGLSTKAFAVPSFETENALFEAGVMIENAEKEIIAQLSRMGAAANATTALTECQQSAEPISTTRETKVVVIYGPAGGQNKRVRNPTRPRSGVDVQIPA